MVLRESGFGQEMRATPGLAPLEEETPPAIAESADQADQAGPGEQGTQGGEQPAAAADLVPTGTPGLENVHRTGNQAFGEEPVGLPYSSVFKDTGANFYHLALPSEAGVRVRDEDFHGKLKVELPKGWADPNLDPLCIHRAFSPEEAHLKLGPIYVRFGELTGAVLASDNINLVEQGRESGYIAMVRLGLTVIAQLTEGWQFSLAGTITYLPTIGKVGLFVGPNSLHGSLLLGYNYAPLVATQISYETKIADWDVIFADDLHASYARFYNRNETRDDFYLFDRTHRNYEDRAGRYVFTAPVARLGGRGDNNGNQLRNLNRDVIYISNALSVEAHRLLPDEIRASVRAVHENFWYPNSDLPGLIAYRDVINAELASERENLRFKPFVGYNAEKSDRMGGFDQTLYGGVKGPITDQLAFLGQAGLFHSYIGNNSFHWLLRLTHEAGPYTTESLEFSRVATEFHDQIEEKVEYHLEQILGPNLTGVAFTQLRRLENNGGDTFSEDAFRVGLRLNYVFSPRTEMSLSAIYAKILDHSADYNSETFTGRWVLRYHPSDTLTAQLLYQYQKLDSTQGTNSYYENVVYLTLTKTFR